LWIPRRSVNSIHILLLRNWFPLENRRKEQRLIALTSTQLTHVFTTSLKEVFMKNMRIIDQMRGFNASPTYERRYS
jgi:hypothetical protein